MTVRYVGSGGSDASNGTSWVTRKLTLNGVEDTPVVAGDIIYVGAGTYRELLTVDVSGTNGSPITYVADVDGSHTDSIGGIVRITGSDDDQTATRANCITATSKDYRTFTGFAFDMTTAALVNLATACGNWIIQDCYVAGLHANVACVLIGGTGTTNIVRRCIFVGGRSHELQFSHASTVSNAAHTVDGCIFIASSLSGVASTRVGGITIKNCTFMQCANAGVRIVTALAAGQTVIVNNCIFAWCNTALSGTATGEIVENYNAFWGCLTERTNTNTGANSNTFPPLFAPLLLLSGYHLPELPLFALSSASPLQAIAGTGMSTDDVYGITRPVSDASKSWGAMQYVASPVRNLPVIGYGVVR